MINDSDDRLHQSHILIETLRWLDDEGKCLVYNLFFILGNGHSCSLEGLQGKNLMLGDRHDGPGNDRSCVSRFLMMNSASRFRQLKRLIKM